MFESIPNELRLLPQWVVAGEDKNPRTPSTGQQADVMDPRTWGTFEEAVRAGARHIGFVLSSSDPYAIIDLDEPANPEQVARHTKIFTSIDSYTELSQSGRGVHIVVKGGLPKGVRRDRVEVYSWGRYMIFTGNVLKALPIVDQQEILDAMYSEMDSTVTMELMEQPEELSDNDILQMACKATNGVKFTALCNGDLTGYPSQSEADFALLSIFCFYSKCDSQVRRLFRMTALGQRSKATRNDDYLNRAMSKIRGKQLQLHPSVDLAGLLAALPPPPSAPATVGEEAEPSAPLYFEPPAPPARATPLPPGLIGEMAEYIYSSATRPVPEMALAAAIGLGAGIVGRYFNISNTGLNQYLIFLAQTGTGKEGAIGGMNALISSVRGQVAADEFIGPGTFASGQALTRCLDKAPCFVSVLGEFGLTLQQICDKHASPHNIQLRKVLLDVFAKSGHNQFLRPSVYSDTEKNTGLVRAPNITILGESTPHNFYGALDTAHISEGLVPRFLVMEYEGARPPRNKMAFMHPSPTLVGQLVILCQTALTMRHNEQCCPVLIDSYALSLLDAYDVHADERINGSGEDEIGRHLWNRAHLKALKLAGLVAVGCGIHNPIVTKEIAQWSIDLVNKDIINMMTKFSSGVVGQGDHQQEADIRSACEKYPIMTPKQRITYKVPANLLDRPQLIPYVFLKRYLCQRASFKNDRRGAVKAMEVSVGDMLKSGMLAQYPAVQAKIDLNTDSPVYYRGEAW